MGAGEGGADSKNTRTELQRQAAPGGETYMQIQGAGHIRESGYSCLDYCCKIKS